MVHCELREFAMSRAFLAMLVEVDKYDVIEIHFLPVGHTHDEHDAWFGKIAVQV